MDRKAGFSKFADSINALAERPLIQGIRQGFMFMVPMLVIGSIVVAILNIPIPAFQEFMLETFGAGWKDFPLIVHNATMQVLSLTAVISIGYSMSLQEKLVKDGIIRPIYPVITAFVSYIAFQRPGEIVDAALSSKAASAQSMFAALVIAIISVKLLFFFYEKYDKLSPEKLYAFNGNAVIRGSFHIIIPILLTILVFAAVNMLINNTGFAEAFTGGFENIFQNLFMRGDILSVILIVLVTQILWFFGIHGGNVFLEAYDAAQQEAIARGLELSAYTKEFFDIFVYFGGAGSTLALVVVLLFFGERNSDRKLAKTAFFPSLLNINEQLVYGLPIVLNPFYAIPFVLAPVFSSIISYIAMSTGLVPFWTNEVIWTMPIFVSGYIATGSASAVILQIICFIVAFLVYLPFVLISRSRAEVKYKDDYRQMAAEMTYLEHTRYRKVMNRNDEVGNVARYLAREIEKAIQADEDQTALHIEYQPKSVKDGRVMGAEALIRWTHPVFGYISPPVILGIAEEANLDAMLGRWIIKQSLHDMNRWIGHGVGSIKLSINLSPAHLNTDDKLGDFIADTMREYFIPPMLVEYELTENATIEQTERLHRTLRHIRDVGSDISIDDFGMGHSSLKYLFDFYANVIKIDISLVQGVTESEEHRIIVRSILDLCKRLNVKVIAEGVETKEQLDIISEMGADYFQGWYFSKALPYEALVEYIRTHGTTNN